MVDLFDPLRLEGPAKGAHGRLGNEGLFLGDAADGLDQLVRETAAFANFD